MDQLGIGRTALYEMFDDGRLRRIKLGRSSRVHRDDLIAFAAGLASTEVSA
jgi:excisionase family DNA binding protein